MRYSLSLLLVCHCAVLADAEEIDFARQVQPILAEHCYECHGADDRARQGGLRLDQQDAALEGGDAYGPAIVPHRPDQSAIIGRITSTDLDEMMPPPEKKKPLSPAHIKVLKTWIAEGGKYEQHWAFTRPKQVATAPDNHPIDVLVSSKLELLHMSLAPRADSATLCRRLHLDLIGLPPTPEEVERFELAFAEDATRAIKTLVDKLIDSPHYGEKWARSWLDVARYSDSNGYEKDLPRDQWAWRDWVIGAYNKDMPYDQFLVEQIAGDLLPNAKQDQLVATGFLRNSMINEEGAIIPEEFRLEEMFDRIDCLGKAVVGLSLQCARCHSHKFDPISQDEYYGIFAFLNNAYEAQSWVYTPDQLEQIEHIRTEVRAAEERLKQERPNWQQDLAAWEAAVQKDQLEWTVIQPTDLGSKSGLNHPTVEPDGSILTLGHPTHNDGIYIVAEPNLQGVTGLRIEALTHRGLPYNGPGRSKYGTWAISEMYVTYQQPKSKEWESLKLVNATADFSEPDARLEDEWKADFDPDSKRVRGPVGYMIDGDEMTGWRADRGPGLRNQESVAVVQFENPLNLPIGTKLKIRFVMQHGGSDNGRHNTMLGCCRLSLTSASDPKADAIDYAAIIAIRTPQQQRTQHQRRAIFTAWRKTRAEAQALNELIDSEWATFPKARTSVLHLAAREGANARVTHLLDRGQWNLPKHDVQPHTPAILHQPKYDVAPTRLDFARWLVDSRSPLTARVAVNRVWQAIFGVGLVETPEDFGIRAPVPVYRDVLDWLAVDFMQNRWSQKQLIRRIVTSATYQQNSKVSAAQLQRDSKNQLLARGPRFRLDAEAIRDTALSIGGLLHREIGGASIYPPVPQSVLDYNFVKPTYWEPPEGANRYRRALYVFRKRSMPDPVLCTLDAPNGDSSIAGRARSNTPLSALVSLNETIFVEAAQAMARRVLREGGSDDAARADYAYRLCTARTIRPEELAIVCELLDEHRNRLKEGKLNATDIAFNRLTKFDELPADATPNDIAAWTIVCRVLLNLDETLTKS